MEAQQKPIMKFREFVALMAMMMSLTALSIDAMLPALSQIGNDLGVTEPNDNQLIISILFLGLAIGQLFYGPLSDAIGRKKAVYIGLVFFFAGCLISIFSDNLFIMLIGRALQGFGLSGTRTISVAIIRDRFKGDKMAQVMSFVMATFIIVPTIAPFMGQGILWIAHWRFIFWTILGLGLILFIWFSTRQQETLKKENRIKFELRKMLLAAKEVFTTRSAIGYTIAAGFISSAFVGFLNSSQQIFQIQYELGEKFPMFFAMIALSVGTASFINGKMVVKHGMQKMVKWASIGVCLFSFIFLCATVFCTGILFGNLNSLAMEPLGHIAGMGAAIVGSVSTFISVPFGVYIGLSYNGTVVPLVIGFAVFGALAMLVVLFFAKTSK
jgi:DHA1 family bicyclomycin/chloramphenicol resistance-like MFS transporter